MTLKWNIFPSIVISLSSLSPLPPSLSQNLSIYFLILVCLFGGIYFKSDALYSFTMCFFLNFWLVYDSCTGSFVVTFPCIHMLYPDLVHPFLYPPSSPTSLLKMTSTGFNVLYSYMFGKYRNHIPPPAIPSP
jgi:hypothetical protein